MRARLTSRFQITLPKKLRDRFNLKAGDSILVEAKNNKIVLRPMRPIHEYRGLLAGIDTDIEREEENPE